MIQATVNTNQKSKSLPYPKLMISEKGTIVLFEESSKGIVLLNASSSCAIGFYSDTWDMNAFKDYYDSITLQNDIP